MQAYPYQLAGVDWLAAGKTRFLCDEPGLGKTIIAILAADRVKAKTTLVVSPTIACVMWERAILDWQQIDRTVQVIRTSADAVHLWGDVIIIGFSLLDRVLPSLRQRQFDLIVVDEAQALKTISAIRTKAIYGREGLIKHTRRVWLLSGTPTPNHPGEWWTHYHSLFNGPLSYAEFVNRYCQVRQTKFGQQIVGANPETSPELARFLAPYTLQRKQADVLADLPPLRWGTIPVRPNSVPPMPEVTREVEAVLGKLERDEAISIVDQMALASLGSWPLSMITQRAFLYRTNETTIMLAAGHHPCPA